MSAPCPVPSCRYDRPGNRMLCGGCEADLARALGDVPWLAAQLDITLAKQGSHASGGRSASIPLPYDPRATEAAFVLKSALVGWVRILVEAHLEDGPADNLPAIGVWLLARVERLAMHYAAGEAVDEVCSAVRAGIRLVDRPAALWYAGPCSIETSGEGCQADLYARPDAATVKCRACGTTYDVVQRRQWMLDAIDDALFHAAGLAHVLTSLGWACTAERIRQWASRGRVVAHGCDGQGRPVYRVSEVREKLADAKRREEERHMRAVAS